MIDLLRRPCVQDFEAVGRYGLAVAVLLSAEPGRQHPGQRLSRVIAGGRRQGVRRASSRTTGPFSSHIVIRAGIYIRCQLS
jgi:hypothetical protein